MKEPCVWKPVLFLSSANYSEKLTVFYNPCHIFSDLLTCSNINVLLLLRTTYVSPVDLEPVFLNIISYFNLVCKVYHVFPWQWNIISLWEGWCFLFAGMVFWGVVFGFSFCFKFVIVGTGYTARHSNQGSSVRETPWTEHADFPYWYGTMLCMLM